MLTSDPILPGKVPSLAELFGLYRRDIFIVAASPVYLNAVEDDLVKGVACLPCPGKQLRIASSASYNGKLREYVRYGGSRMMKDLNSNMTTLNIKHAGMLIHEMGIRPDTEC
ncbi:tgtA5 cluster protein 2 [Klebsiella pneumoniae]|nr:tgtA5 cluster protein 2 [Klebsiella pneumoniae]